MATTDTNLDVVRPFADMAWNQTAAKSCAQELYWLRTAYEPKSVRPDRLLGIDRRNRGSGLHDFGRLSLHLLFERGAWPNAERTLRAVLTKGGGKDRPGDLLGFMKGPGYNNLWDALGELMPKAVMFQERFKFTADDRIGSEHFVAIDADGEVANYFEVPAGGYHGRIDWAELSSKTAPVPNQLRVIDFKNRPAIHPRAEIIGHEQLSFYAWMLAKHYPQARAVPCLVGIYYFEYGVTNEEEVSWDVIDANVERLLARIRHKVSLRVVDIAPEPGFGRCQYCDFVADCPEGTRLTEAKQGAIVDADSASQAARSLFVIDELRDATRNALKAYCEENGPVLASSDTGFGFVQHPEMARDAKAISGVLKKAGIDPWTVLKIDSAELEKITKKDKDLDAACEAHVKESRVGTTFKAFKPKKDSKVIMTPKVRGRVKSPKDKKTTDKKKPDVMVTPAVK